MPEERKTAMNETQHNPNTRNDKVQLGCGTLILIALIVMIFSGGGGVRNLESEIQGLKTEVRQLREAVDALTQTHSTNGVPVLPNEPAADLN